MNPRRAARVAQAGFSMVEACTALAILMVAVLGSVQMYFYGLDKLRAHKEGALATQIVGNEIEHLRAQPYDALAPGALPLAATDLSTTGLINAEGGVQITDCVGFDGGLREVRVRLRWTGEKGRTIERSLTTRIADRRAPW